ncbi:MAG: hypothetical protein K8L97_01615 [Anaerolineae bacterium]|nr:hypothetical protein [Anaerolineae bacterium]
MAGFSIRKSKGKKSVTDELVDQSAGQLTHEQLEYLERLKARFGEDVELVDADWGNANWKQQKAGRPADRTIMANRITVIDESQWEQTCRRAQYSKQRFSNTLLFGVRERKKAPKGEKIERRMMYVAAGDYASNYGTPTVMTDDIKYEYNLYWGKVVAANLLRMFPNGHENIVLALAHPMKSIGQRQLMMELTLGPHVVETMDGKTVRFVVREILPWDEPVGGAVAWACGGTGEDLVYNKYDFKPGDMVMLHDVGGGVSSMSRLQVDYDGNGKLMFVPLYNQRQSPTIEFGVVHVEEGLREILLQERKEFRGMGPNLTPKMLSEGIRTGFITLSNKPVDVRNEVMMAEAILIEPTFKAYNGSMAGGRPFRLIVCSGGGMHNYFERFKKELYNHETVEEAIAIENIQWANLIGGDEIMRQWVEAEIGNG